MAWIPLMVVTVAAVVDLRTRQIPDTLPVCLLVWAVAVAVSRHAAHPWMPFALGLVIAFAVGAALFAAGAFGGGDVKLLTGIGAVVGWPSVLSLLYYSALAGGALALIAAVRGQKELAYGPAMALGLLALTVWRV